MATYKEIKGTQIEAVATDPSNPVEGQVWYNTTSNVLKGQAATAAGAWATGGALNTARQLGQSGAGTRDAALVAGGEPFTGKTEEYNGTAWTEVADLNTARRNNATIGANTEAALSFAGSTPPNSNSALNEQWNGSSWTEITDLNTAGRARQGSGITTAALAFGGGSPAITNTETWNGSSWTEVNDLNTARYYFAASGYGPNTATLAFGGETTLASNELWNGSNWTEVNDLNTGRRVLCGAGISTSALAFGGYSTASVTLTELWNGTNWTETTDLNVARHELGGTGSTNGAAIAAGGYAPSAGAATNATEEFTGAGAGLTRTFTDS